jgi:hypothetical protein
MAVMALCFPIPGYIASKIQNLQQQAMKKTDARVQTVTESQLYIHCAQCDYESYGSAITSDGCHSHDQAVWLGA